MLPSDGLFGAFDPEAEKDRWFERHRAIALLLALFAHAVLAGVVVYLEMTREEATEEVLLAEPEIENLEQDFVEEEEEEPELEVEMEPEPEPEPEPKKRQEIRNVKEQTKDVTESEVAPQRPQVEYDEPEPEPETKPEAKPDKKPEAKPHKKAPKKTKKKAAADVGDRTEPRPMPAEGTPPKPLPSNRAPAYPEALRKKNITGSVKVKLKIYMDGSVRGMKVLRKNVKGTEDPEEVKRAQSLFLKAVVSVVKTWKFQPAKLKGQTITVWWPVTFPFNLS